MERAGRTGQEIQPLSGADAVPAKAPVLQMSPALSETSVGLG